jgi:hypothetical protein
LDHYLAALLHHLCLVISDLNFSNTNPSIHF